MVSETYQKVRIIKLADCEFSDVQTNVVKKMIDQFGSIKMFDCAILYGSTRSMSLHLKKGRHLAHYDLDRIERLGLKFRSVGTFKGSLYLDFDFIE